MRRSHLLIGTGALIGGAKLAGDLGVRNYEDVDLEATAAIGSLAWLDNVRVHYLDQGSGPPLVLLHGLGSSTYSFRHNLPALSSRFRVVAPDMPGYGLSSRDVPDLSLTAQARYLASFLDQLGIERASIAGHSMGGSVAQRFALMWPDRVDRLVLIASTTDEYMLRGAWASFMMAPFVPFFVTAVMHNPVLREQWVRRAVHDSSYLTPEIRANYAQPGHIIGHVAAYQRLMLHRRRDLPIDVSAIKAPTLILWGDTDRVVSLDHGRRLAAIPDSRLELISKAGHWVQEERAEEVNALISGFLTASEPDARRRLASARRGEDFP